MITIAHKLGAGALKVQRFRHYYILILQLTFSWRLEHGKLGEAYTRLKTASCEAGPGTTHMCTLEICIWSLHIRCLDDCATPQLDTVTLRPTPSGTVTIRPRNVFILRQSDPTWVGQSDHTQTAQSDPLEVGLNVGCDNPTHEQSDPCSVSPAGYGQFGRRHTDGTVKKRCCATQDNFTHAWVSWAQAWPNLTPNMSRPTQQNST